MGYRDVVDGPCPGSYLPGTALPYVRDRGALVTVRCQERFPRAIAEIGPP